MKVTFGRRDLWKDICEESDRANNKFGLQRVPRWENIRFCCLDKEWMTDVFRETDIAGIKHYTPTCIVAQTGSGKTTLIFKVCVPLAIKEHGKILYLAGRVSLATQVKEDAMSDSVNGEMQGDYMKVRDMKKEYSRTMIKRCHNFGAIDIYTYQELLSHIESMDFSRYTAVIFDEAHFFMSDATFNPFTEEILNRLLKKAVATRRIYLTATPEEAIEDISLL